MRIVFLTVLLVLSLISTARDYTHICSPGITYYQSSGGEIKAFRRDSVQPLGNGDTMFNSYRTIRQYALGSCHDTTNGSVLGRKILRLHDDRFCFFNLAGDSVWINTQASLNESWRFCSLPGNGHIQATVSAVVDDSILGVPDQVKVISFQAKDSAGNDFTHPLNQETIRLSRHYGLSRMLDVPMIPTDTVDFIIAGKSNPAIGLQDLAWPQIYDYSVGDEFHYRYLDAWAGSFGYQKYEILQVLDRADYGGDSVVYTMERCRWDTTMNPPVSTTLHDTISLKYDFALLESNNSGWFSKMPDEFIRQYDYADGYNRNFAYPGRQAKSVMYSNFVYDPFFSGCWTWLGQPECWGVFQSRNQYADGLGMTDYYEQCYSNNMLVHIKYNQLKYYKKGTETWGNPVAADCWALTGMKNTIRSAVNVVKIIPNPVMTMAQVVCDACKNIPQRQVVIHDCMGKEIRRFMAEVFPIELNRSGMPDGWYVLTIYGADGSLIGRTKLIVSK